MGSDFLRDFEKQEILAGKLHTIINAGQGAQMQGGTSGQPSKAPADNNKLKNFFESLEQQNQPSQMAMADQSGMPPTPKVINAEAFKRNFGFYGKYPLYILRQREVLVNIEIEGKKLETIMKRCSLVFYDDLDHGFKVDLIFEESDTRCVIFGMATNEAILETFLIEKHMLAEMRRTFTTKATIKLGCSTFNVFQLVFLLNEIQSKIYSFGISNRDDDNGKKQGASAIAIEKFDARV